MAEWTVRDRGPDTSGRRIYASDYMWDWWLQVVADLGFTPTITQGAWMVKNGGGASDSAGYHDGGGCFDLRVWDRTSTEVSKMIRVIRANGAAAWLRDMQHGGFSDPHIHLVLGTDHDLDSGAAYQWQQYLNGRDGLASNGPDYHWRPSPLVTKPPERDWFDMATEADLRAIVADEIKKALAKEQTNGRNLRANVVAIANKVGVKPIKDKD